MKLIYIGRQDMGDTGIDGRMWNIIDVTSPYHLSTRTLDGLKEMGVIHGY